LCNFKNIFIRFGDINNIIYLYNTNNRCNNTTSFSDFETSFGFYFIISFFKFYILLFIYAIIYVYIFVVVVVICFRTPFSPQMIFLVGPLCGVHNTHTGRLSFSACTVRRNDVVLIDRFLTSFLASDRLFLTRPDSLLFAGRVKSSIRERM